MATRQASALNALDASVHERLLAGEKAAAVFADPPYNVRIDGNVCGGGAIKHREFAIASGEMSEQEFTAFLTRALEFAREDTVPGATLFICMDWRHMSELLAAARSTGCEDYLCVWSRRTAWAPTTGRDMNSVSSFATAPRRTSTTCNSAGSAAIEPTSGTIRAPTVSAEGRKSDLGYHPAVNPIAMVADAILDSTCLDDIVIDPFLGSGTTVLATERTGRRCYGR